MNQSLAEMLWKQQDYIQLYYTHTHTHTHTKPLGLPGGSDGKESA